ncbi:MULTISPECIES: Holliday junction resolvase RuvX [Tepidanaerobacter]|uniref:Putative pre-16S rRNA nuclease n=1 Tax=Tepidanaerobacter syntrophicus TaxID=224999 RepID=A0A0U9HH15_9FIRM|nr:MULTISPECIES: Holliday junction resolvase RuvX [Tepidanaerobacter]GAQ26101.1 holliday junction resolvase [Tepidanaerobacter syntrophicus]GLI19088.1 putative pre-16S rRNA nuclease [Tepidanaerobacter syntrophicus]GLI50282.1 putative pre-16S rRNA nuclease [Tepidanaerobacter syntrophicus]HHV82093.1 Holliday junction resolvase RuvX [Tepidanaerobacter syntrophicus]
MRILCLDVGEKRIGVAVSDELGITAQGLGTVERKQNSKDEDIEEIRKIVEKYNVDKIILGLPKNMDGTLGQSGKMVEDYAKKLQSCLNIDLGFWDERLSTVSAERVLIDADISRKKRKSVIDKLSAVIILQSYLDYKSRVDTM